MLEEFQLGNTIIPDNYNDLGIYNEFPEACEKYPEICAIYAAHYDNDSVPNCSREFVNCYKKTFKEPDSNTRSLAQAQCLEQFGDCINDKLNKTTWSYFLEHYCFPIMMFIGLCAVYFLPTWR